MSLYFSNLRQCYDLTRAQVNKGGSIRVPLSKVSFLYCGMYEINNYSF